MNSEALLANPTSLRANLRELWAYRELLLMFVQRDLKVRYKNSVIGFGWSLVNPLVQVLTITVVILFLMPQKQRPENYHAYVFCATLPWLFFNTALMDSTNALLSYYNLLRKTYFPREILPIAVVIANLIHFAMATAALLLYLTANSLFWWAVGGSFDFPIQVTVLLLPIPMLGLTLLVSGCAMFLCVWTLYFEDVRFIVDSGLKVLYWLVPVIYFGEVVLHQAGKAVYTAYMLNPLAGFITAFRKLTLPPTKLLGVEKDIITTPMGVEEWLFLAAAWGVSALVAWIGLRFFIRRKWKLAERA